ncbi:ABC transporter ATP-binding protein [Nitratireductor sp. ZSWI3]|uniref:ABC transporter ATP-binding protein n=1 Tax=Nitratireductor sp. ZSWI3 TaxID=2966359 RepID=UPI00214FA70C|nr:ATP-binding cassette domain-containing protein [Nitratireductor sp. ZSWI3]MCR4268928.1 ATP-binding cassette domain-containing protein [Nitratireductor sp. ZSWI3]
MTVDAATLPDTRNPAAPKGRGFAAQDVVVRAGGRTLLGISDLAFRPGEVCGLIGHNGSGKSTLLKLLARQMAPDHGTVLFGGRAVGDFSSRDFARAVAWLPQNLPAADSLTVAELVALGRYPWHGALGRFSARHREACAEAIAATGVDPLAGRLVDTLSGGERQRAWLAMLLAQSPECMLLDEPIAALDLVHQLGVMDLVRSCARERGMGVVVVLHDVNIAARFCDRVVALKGGHVVHDLAPEALMTPAVLEEIYGLPMHVVSAPGTSTPLGFAL